MPGNEVMSSAHMLVINYTKTLLSVQLALYQRTLGDSKIYYMPFSCHGNDLINSCEVMQVCQVHSLTISIAVPL